MIYVNGHWGIFVFCYCSSFQQRLSIRDWAGNMDDQLTVTYLIVDPLSRIQYADNHDRPFLPLLEVVPSNVPEGMWISMTASHSN
jgi:hypothetical protein